MVYVDFIVVVVVGNLCCCSFLFVVSSLVQPCRACHFLKESEWNGNYSVNVVFALTVVYLGVVFQATNFKIA